MNTQGGEGGACYLPQPHIFRQYDIRGIAGQDLTEPMVRLIGESFGSYLRERGLKKVSVGRDARLSSPAFAAALMEGLRCTGCDVVDLGQVPTPCVYYSIEELGTDGAAVVTASHNPPQFNGFKLRCGQIPLTADELQLIRKTIEEVGFATGAGSLKQANIIPSYLDWIQSRVRLARPLKVVVDCANGTNGPVTPELLRRLGCQVEELFCEPDGNFPNHPPDPVKEENLAALKKKVLEFKADLGLAVDGDGDRIALVDEQGRAVPVDYIAILLAREALERKPGASIAVDVRISQSLIEDVEKRGGRILISKCGYPHLLEKMKAAAFGGEVSGHMYFDDERIHFDDATFGCAKLAEYISRQGAPLSQILADVPQYFALPEERVACPDDRKFQVVEKLKETLASQYRINDIDGVKVLFDDGWGLVRASNTAPELTMRFEAKTPERTRAIEALVKGLLRPLL
jgi:phosphomannomutase/phosphoglucomutase